MTDPQPASASDRRFWLVAGLVAAVALGLLFLCGGLALWWGAQPAQEPAAPAELDYSRYTDPARQADYRAFAVRTRELSDSWSLVYAADGYYGEQDDLLGEAWDSRAEPLAPAAAALLDTTAAWRDEVIGYLLACDPTLYLDSGTCGDPDLYPHFGCALTAARLAALDALRRQRRGDGRGARAEADRLLGVAGQLIGSGSLMGELYGYAVAQLAAAAVVELYPLGRPPAGASSLADRLVALDAEMDTSLAAAFTGEALSMETMMVAALNEEGVGVMMNTSRLRRKIREQYLELIRLSRLNPRAVAARLLRDAERRPSRLEQVFHPIDSVLLAISTPKLGTTILKRDAARSVLRRAALQLRLGRALPPAPPVVDERYPSALLDPLTGDTFAWPPPAAGGRLDLSIDEYEQLGEDIQQARAASHEELE